MTRTALARIGLALSATVLALAVVAIPSQATAGESAPAAPAYDGRLDVLFIGAHPDDEAGGLSTYGQWRENSGISTGVITVTRGEGGGNAVGPEEGPPLGLLRESEERRAVGRAGVTDVHNLDDVDFYYTVSEPLTRQVWGHQDTLAKVVRIIRETRPKVIVTMNPAPSPGNHGNHQEAARLAIEAFYAASDPGKFPEQLTKEGLNAWQPARIFSSGGSGAGPTGDTCESTFTPADPSQDVYGIWSGRPSAKNAGKSWAQVEREAQREYASQGWAGFPDVSTDPTKLACDRFTQIDSRVPYAFGGTAEAATPTAMLQGALVPAPGGLPLGTKFWLEAERFGVAAGVPFKVTAHANVSGSVRLTVPSGWKVAGTGFVVRGKATFEVTPAANTAANLRIRIAGSLTSKGKTGTTSRIVETRPAVRGMPQLLPQVDQYEKWAASVGVPQVSGRVLPVLSLGSGASRTVRVDLSNQSETPQSGSVRLNLPTGFAADENPKSYDTLQPGATGSVSFTVTNTDATLPTSNAGGDGGDYKYTIETTTTSGATDIRNTALELVPVTTVPQAGTAPTVDGVEGTGEYTGPVIDLSRRWEGEACASAADCSATAKATWNSDDLYLVVHVTDDTLGTVLDREDCKRHWRTDSVEIALDARGTSENTSTTFKTGIFPLATDNAGPCFERDADNHQGPNGTSAPGMRVASKVNEPYNGYTIETKIALADLPNAVDPNRLGLNVFVYDSDTQDKTGQTRIGWSTWGGVQGDPYRWGLATLPGYTPPSGRPTTPVDPVIPTDVAKSVDSPQSILQSASNGVPLAGEPEAPRNDTGTLAGPASVKDGKVRGAFAATGPGTAHIFVWKNGILGSKTLTFTRAGILPYDITGVSGSTVLAAFDSKAGGTHSSTRPVT